MKNILISIRLLLLLSIITGIFYPVVMTTLSKAVFKSQAEGSVITSNGKIIGSKLLSQKTTDPKYFWPRPSGADYATVSSGASNQGILSKTLADSVISRRKVLAKPGITDIPSDLLYASGSGLDPHISPAAASYQMDRVASARNFNEPQKNTLVKLIEQSVEGPQYGIFGEARVNVLVLNLALDKL